MVHFCNIFVFQNLLKDEAVLKTPFFCKTEEKRRPVPALTIPFPFLFCEAEDEGRPEPALTILRVVPVLFLTAVFNFLVDYLII